MSIFSFFKKIANNTTEYGPPKADSLNYTEGNLQVIEQFSIGDKGIVLIGKILSGGIKVGFVFDLGAKVIGIEKFGKKLNYVTAGEEVGIFTDFKNKDLMNKFVNEQSGKVVKFYVQELKK